MEEEKAKKENIDAVEETLKEGISRYGLNTLVDLHITHKRLILDNPDDDKLRIWKISSDELKKRGYGEILDKINDAKDLSDESEISEIMELAKDSDEIDKEIRGAKEKLSKMDMDTIEGMMNEIMSEDGMMHKLSVLDEYKKRTDSMEQEHEEKGVI